MRRVNVKPGVHKLHKETFESVSKYDASDSFQRVGNWRL